MGSKIALTNRSVTALKPREKRYGVHDRDLTGFAVYVAPGGSKTFFVYSKVSGRPVRHMLGSFPALNCEDARRKAKMYIGDVAAGRTKTQRGKSGRATINELFDHYVAVHARPRKRTWERDVAEYDRLVRKSLGTRLVTELQKADVAGLLNRIEAANGKGPARKVRALLHKMFEVAIDDGWTQTNPVRGTARPEFDPRHRYLKPAEVKAFVDALAQLTREVSRDFIWLAMFTGQRRSNVCTMRWDEIDFDRETWTIPASKYKGKRLHVVPLAAPAMAVLRRRWKDRPRENPWVLPSHGPKGHYNNPKTAFAKVLELAGLKDLRIHDLRRSVGAWMQSDGANLRTIQQAMGHSSIDITARVYSPTEETQVRQSLAAVADAMLKAAGQQIETAR